MGQWALRGDDNVRSHVLRLIGLLAGPTGRSFHGKHGTPVYVELLSRRHRLRLAILHATCTSGTCSGSRAMAIARAFGLAQYLFTE